ncbi:MAG: 50S ribosomal protein L17 [Alphaproteobacteria bacterium]|jgi:large subunit ribosomal protein L17|nr:50S ribosomal protein L17 [Alphaproteobacteria bacterium]
MRHRISGRKFSRTTSQRRALLSGLAYSLIEKEQIRTTLPKAKDLRPYVEKLITLGKEGSLAARRRLVGILHSETLAAKLIDTLGTRYRERAGGYTRIIKAGFRYGDAAPMAVIELLDRDPSAKKGPEVIVTANEGSLEVLDQAR